MTSQGPSTIECAGGSSPATKLTKTLNSEPGPKREVTNSSNNSDCRNASPVDFDKRILFKRQRTYEEFMHMDTLSLREVQEVPSTFKEDLEELGLANRCSPGMACQSWKYAVLGIMSISIISTTLHILCVTSPGWEYVTFDIDLLKKKVGNCFEDLQQGISGVYWLPFKGDKNATKSCSKTKGVIVAPETGGLWNLCKDIPEEFHERLLSLCYPAQKSKYFEVCNHYLHMNHNHSCCNGCYAKKAEDFDELTIEGVMKTLLSSIIVSFILQTVAWLIAVISLLKQNVQVTMLTGITFMLSAIFLMFAVIIEHYKLHSVMAFRGLSPTPLPKLITNVRSGREGWAIYLGWGSVATTFAACIAWFQLCKGLSTGSWKTKPIDFNSCFDGIATMASICRGQNKTTEVHPMNGIAVQVPARNGRAVEVR